MTVSQREDTPTRTVYSPIDDEIPSVLGAELGAKYLKLRRQFEAAYPDLFADDKALSRPERKRLIDERNRLWSEFLGIETPLVPSSLDSTRDAGCLKCRDTGWVHPRSYAAPVALCPNCNQQDEQRERARLAYSGIPDTQKCATFESFKVLPGTEAAFSAAHDLVFGASFWMVLLVGAYGNGKTHLAYAAVREALHQGMRAKFIYWPDMLAEYRRRMDRNEEPQVYVEEIKRVQFLGLDEIGFTSSTEFQAGLLEELVNHRYSERLHTIMTTNRDIKTLPPAIISRFSDREVAKIVLNKGQDHRPRKRPERSL